MTSTQDSVAPEQITVHCPTVEQRLSEVCSNASVHVLQANSEPSAEDLRLNPPYKVLYVLCKTELKKGLIPIPQEKIYPTQGSTCCMSNLKPETKSRTACMLFLTKACHEGYKCHQIHVHRNYWKKIEENDHFSPFRHPEEEGSITIMFRERGKHGVPTGDAVCVEVPAQFIQITKGSEGFFAEKRRSETNLHKEVCNYFHKKNCNYRYNCNQIHLEIDVWKRYVDEALGRKGPSLTQSSGNHGINDPAKECNMYAGTGTLSQSQQMSPQLPLLPAVHQNQFPQGLIEPVTGMNVPTLPQIYDRNSMEAMQVRVGTPGGYLPQLPIIQDIDFTQLPGLMEFSQLQGLMEMNQLPGLVVDTTSILHNNQQNQPVHVLPTPKRPALSPEQSIASCGTESLNSSMAADTSSQGNRLGPLSEWSLQFPKDGCRGTFGTALLNFTDDVWRPTELKGHDAEGSFMSEESCPASLSSVSLFSDHRYIGSTSASENGTPSVPFHLWVMYGEKEAKLRNLLGVQDIADLRDVVMKNFVFPDKIVATDLELLHEEKPLDLRAKLSECLTSGATVNVTIREQGAMQTPEA